MSSRSIAVLLAACLCACGPGVVTPSPSTSPVILPIVGTPIPEVASPGASVGALPQGADEAATTSAPVASPSAPATPTPTPDPSVWRFEGRVVDADGNGIRDVCVVIGPHGCQRGSIRTDERGVYFIDMPQVPTVVYDLYFVKDGYLSVWYRVQPTEPTVFNVILHKPQSRKDRSAG